MEKELLLKYHLLKLKVYRAYNVNNEVFAIKKVKKAPITNKMREKQSRSLAEEVFIMRSLNHPNIPKLYEVFESEGSYL